MEIAASTILRSLIPGAAVPVIAVSLAGIAASLRNACALSISHIGNKLKTHVNDGVTVRRDDESLLPVLKFSAPTTAVGDRGRVADGAVRAR